MLNKYYTIVYLIIIFLDINYNYILLLMILMDYSSDLQATSNTHI